ncbi:unnamed protein product [Ectocarpus sp. 8 AP-2014]
MQSTIDTDNFGTSQRTYRTSPEIAELGIIPSGAALSANHAANSPLSGPTTPPATLTAAADNNDAVLSAINAALLLFTTPHDADAHVARWEHENSFNLDTLFTTPLQSVAQQSSDSTILSNKTAPATAVRPTASDSPCTGHALLANARLPRQQATAETVSNHKESCGLASLSAIPPQHVAVGKLVASGEKMLY